MVIDGAMRVTLSLNHNSFVNRWSMGYTVAADPLTDTVVDDVLTHAIAFWGDVDHRDWRTTTCSLQRIEVRDLSSVNGYVADIDNLSSPGTDGTTPVLPAGVAIAVTLRTGVPGRSNRGRVYFGGFTARAGTTAASAPAGLITDVQDTMLDLYADILNAHPNVIGLAVGSRTYGYWRPVTEVGVSGEWDYQRRRAFGA